MNGELADLVLKTIEADPAHWEQSVWRTMHGRAKAVVDEATGQKVFGINCRTAFCFAGWAVQLGSEETPKWVSSDTLLAIPEDATCHGTISASERAARLLGINARQAMRLFSSGNELEEIKRLVENLKEEG